MTLDTLIQATASPDTAQLETLTLARLDDLVAIEAQAQVHPWTRGQFLDAMASGYSIVLLTAGAHILGYTVAMRGVEEAHLLNLTVAPAHQRQGWAHMLLDALALWARSEGLPWLWLEVRHSNLRAQQVYAANGFAPVGLRPRYYPATNGVREDAIVMSRPL